ncbi:MAG: HAMP domain-containing histidine kinase [Proteobacteria bacterium]|nr:HAMP domain-containing histidine kinase [Pseudomonadota bacterium]MBU1641229.1 HAMP domain-containing histidine kinase [Pseudomonadota bacterium]
MKWHAVALRRKSALVLAGFFLLLTGISCAALLHVRQINQQLFLADTAAQLHTLMVKSSHFAEGYIAKNDPQAYEQLEDGLKKARAHLRLMTGLLVAILLVTSALVVWVWQGLLKPLKAVVSAAQAVADNTYEPIPLKDGPAEIRQVLLVFNAMAADTSPRHAQVLETAKLNSLGTLASGAAHQLNNPLNNISTSCQIALAELDEGDLVFIKKMLHTIQQESQRASNMVRGLLEFSRSQIVHLAPGHMGTIVRGVLQLVDGEVPAGVAIKTDIADNLLVHIDSQKMTEVMLNLVSNSIHALGENGGVISISARADDEQAQAIVKVRDTGEGIDKGQLKNIFEPFFTTKKALGGAGLGLAIVDAIIRKHQGRITVESIGGEGTEFTITLPLLHIDQDAAALDGNNKKV